MMLDAVTFDLGCARSPTFVFPDASGLAPLTLPEAFLRGQSHQPQPEPPSETVRRFEAAMSAEPQLTPSVVESLMAHMSSGSPKDEGQEVESPKAKSPTVEEPEVESQKVKSPTIEGLKIQSPKPEFVSVVNPVPVASVEKPAVLTADTVVQGDSVVRPVDEKPVVASPEQPKVPVVTRSAEPAVVIGTAPVKPAERPTVATGATSVHEGSVVRLVDEKPVAAAPVSVDKPVASAVETTKVVTVEKPVAVAPAAAPAIAPVVLEKPERPVKVEDQPVAAGNALIAPAAPSAKPVEIVEMPVAVDKPIVASVEPSVRAAVGEAEVISANATIPADPVVRPVDEKPVAVIEKAPAMSVDKPMVSWAGQPTTATVEVPTVATTEKPVAVAPAAASTIAPAVLEKPEHPAKVEDQPVVAGNTLIAPAAPSAKPVEIVEMPVAVDKPTAASVEPSVRAAVGEPEIVSANETIPVDPVVRSANESPVVASPEQPRVQLDARPAKPAPAIEKAPAIPAERPMFATPDNPTVVKTGSPVVESVDKPEVSIVGRPPVATVEVPAEEPPVTANSTLIVPDVPAAKPVSRVETPVIAVPAETNVISEKVPVVPDERPVAAKAYHPAVATVDKPEEKAVAASAHAVVAPAAVEAPAPQAIQAAPEVAAASAASARTEALVETVNQIVEAVVGQILVTPGITQSECEIKIMLKPTVLDGSEVAMSAKDGTLTVSITPATQEASAAAAAALPRLEIALAEHAPAFHHVSVALQLKKGNRNEAV